jgi:Bacteriophage head to tail connecting protein
MATADRYATATPRTIPDSEQQEVHDILRLFSELQTYRNVFANQWEEAAMLILPTSRNTFYYGSYNWPGQKKTQQQVDATGALALTQFCAITDSLVTPKNQKWHGLRGDPYVMKDRACRLYLDAVRDVLFDFRYRPIGNFHGQNTSNWQSLGAFGNSAMYVDRFDGRWSRGARGLRYKSVPLGECFFGENHQGVVTTMIRWFRKTAEQAVEEWGIDALPAMLRPALEQGLQTPFNFLHCVRPREPKTFDPERLDEKGKPFSSCYVSIEGQCTMAPEGGFRVFPYAVSRYDQTPGEVYGRGPAQLVLPGLKTLNAQKATFLKTGHRIADPVLLTQDDGLVNFTNRPGALNPGGVSPDGKPLVHPLPVGNLQTSKEMMDEERSIIEATFLTSLFKVLTEHPDMTATQVIELLNERGMLVAPTLGRQHSEYVGGMVEREIDLLADMTDMRGRPILPPMPPRLREARGEYQITDTSPLAMAARANEAAGFVRTVETVKELVNVTQDMSLLDPFDFPVAIPEIAQIQSVPERWMADAAKQAAKAKARAQNQQRQEQIQAMPAQAAMLKAQATVQKNQPGIAPQQAFGGPQQQGAQ